MHHCNTVAGEGPLAFKLDFEKFHGFSVTGDHHFSRSVESDITKDHVGNDLIHSTEKFVFGDGTTN